MLTQPSLATRRYDLDWLRVLAFGLLIFYHTSMFFVSWGWHIKNNVISTALESPMLFVNQWRMSLLFLISGAAVFFALDKMNAATFAGDRFKRLFIPLVFGMLFIVPPQIYFERLTQGLTLSYPAFQATVFQFKPYPLGGSLSWHHLWYLVYLLVYSLVLLPGLVWLKGRGRHVLDKTALLVSRFPWLLYLVALVQFGIVLLFWHNWETTHNLVADGYNHALSASFFVIGFLLCMHPAFGEAIEKLRGISLSLGLLSATALFVFYWSDWKEIDGVPLAGYWLLKTANRWCWLLAILGFGKRHLAFNSPVLRYASPAVYPFYILHQTVIITIAYFLINEPWSVAAKFGFISTTTFLTCWLLYEFLIRRFRVTRFLFGMKTRSPKAEKQMVVL